MKLLTRRLCHRLDLLIAVPAEEGDQWHERVVVYEYGTYDCEDQYLGDVHRE